MRCSWGGCQTDAVVSIMPAAPCLSGDVEQMGDGRPACRNHMAVICQEHPLTIVEALSVTDKEET